MISISRRQSGRDESVVSRTAMCDVRSRWVGGPGGGTLAILAVVACLLWVAARHWATPAGQAEYWAGLPSGVNPGGIAKSRPARASRQVLRPRRPRPHTPPTWQQEREWARAELRSLCQEARQMASWFEHRAGSPQYDHNWPAVTAKEGQALHLALARAAQEEARIEAQLDQARGFRDLDAAQREIWKIRRVVFQVRPWFVSHRMVGGLDGRQATRPEELPPGGRETSHRRRDGRRPGAAHAPVSFPRAARPGQGRMRGITRHITVK